MSSNPSMTENLIEPVLLHLFIGLQDDLVSMSARLKLFLTAFDKVENYSPHEIVCGIDLREEVRRFEILMIYSALIITDQNQKRASELLQLRPTTLHSKIKRYGISRSL